jgi:hypothetical protein
LFWSFRLTKKHLLDCESCQKDSYDNGFHTLVKTLGLALLDPTHAWIKVSTHGFMDGPQHDECKQKN